MKFSIKDYLYPVKIFSQYRSLSKSAYFPYNKLEELQSQKLRKLIVHSYENVPYYRELFDKEKLKPEDIQTTKDLVHIPVLTKDILRERFDDLTAINSKQFRPYINRTSGSTGTPLQFMQDKNVSIARFAFFWHIWQMAGYKPYMRWAQIDGMFIGDSKKIWKYSYALNSLQISAYKLNTQNCISIIQKLNDFNPKIIRGYPSALEILAANIVEQKLPLNFNVKSVITYSEKLHKHQRHLLEKAFNCKVYDIYSMWEAVCIISECDHNNKHQHMEYSAMELLNENNQPVESGITGEITATSFYNYSMPFIRYKTGDLANLSQSKCSCDRNHLIVENIDGRADDIIITPDGNKIGRISPAFSPIKGINYAQIVQNQIEIINIYLVKNKDFNSDTLSQLEIELRKRVGKTIMIEFYFVEDIKPSSNGKRRLVINNIKK